MAKIKIYKLKGNQNKGEKITSIDRCDDNDIKERLQTNSELLKQQCLTRVRSREVVVLEQSDDNEKGLEM